MCIELDARSRALPISPPPAIASPAKKRAPRQETGSVSIARRLAPLSRSELDREIFGQSSQPVSSGSVDVLELPATPFTHLSESASPGDSVSPSSSQEWSYARLNQTVLEAIRAKRVAQASDSPLTRSSFGSPLASPSSPLQSAGYALRPGVSGLRALSSRLPEDPMRRFARPNPSRPQPLSRPGAFASPSPLSLPQSPVQAVWHNFHLRSPSSPLRQDPISTRLPPGLLGMPPLRPVSSPLSASPSSSLLVAHQQRVQLEEFAARQASRFRDMQSLE